MKKIISVTLLALLVALLPVGLIGCKKNTSSKLVGIWEYYITQYLDGDRTVKYEVDEYKSGSYSPLYVLTSNKKGIFVDDFHRSNLTWTFDGSKLVIIYLDEDGNPGQREILYYKNGNLVRDRSRDEEHKEQVIYKKNHIIST